MPSARIDLPILRTLVLGTQHGWAMAERVQQVSSDVLRIQQGSLYPALHRLERRGGSKRIGERQKTIAVANTAG
jgi:PadR family transcriptional regulator, regulatory protein PadR